MLASELSLVLLLSFFVSIIVPYYCSLEARCVHFERSGAPSFVLSHLPSQYIPGQMYMFSTQGLSVLCSACIFSHSVDCLFRFLNSIFYGTRVFSFGDIQFMCFFFLLLALLFSYLVDHCLIQRVRDLLLLFSLRDVGSYWTPKSPGSYI